MTEPEALPEAIQFAFSEGQTVIVEQWWVECLWRGAGCVYQSLSISAILLIRVVMSGEVDGRHSWVCITGSNSILNLLVGQFLLRCQICIRVEVYRTHRAVAVISRSTIYAVGTAEV